jgi:hemoglobin-like flavoprotein
MIKIFFMVGTRWIPKARHFVILRKSEGGIRSFLMGWGVPTAEQTLLLRKSFDVVERQTHVAALIFYQRLFELEPRLRLLFKTDIESQATKLIEMLSVTLGLLERQEELTGTLEHIGASHVGYGVEPSHYGIAEDALLTMLERVLGGQFTKETRQAWVELYQCISQAMLRGAAKAST